MYQIDKKLETAGLDNCVISEISLAELVFGAENSSNPDKNLALIDEFLKFVSTLPILDAIPYYGKEKVRLRKRGLMISDFDLLIGCTAVEKDLIMITENIREFERISKIRIENWVNRS
jgi:tRNA(fMet)-specific endonuclease VapC